jgi:UDP-glucose 4-epimerase
MRILLTGASSFTGTWFVKALAEAGHDVFATLTQPRLEDYSGVRRRRVELMAPWATPLWNCLLGDEQFFAAVRQHGPWDLFCHHGAEVRDYRSDDFPVIMALINNINNLPSVLAALGGQGCRRLLLTGSVFEADEGAGDSDLRAFSPYGLSKTLTYQAARYYSRQAGFQWGKFVIPNPFGPYEEKRFTSYLARSWLEGDVPVVETPDYVRDNIPVSLLAVAYRDFAERLAGTDAPSLRCYPSCYVETQAEFAKRFAAEMGARWPDVACRFELARQAEFPEPLRRYNTEAMKGRFGEWSEAGAWDELAEYYLSAFAKSEV